MEIEKRGFTLKELFIVAVILCVVSAVLVLCCLSSVVSCFRVLCVVLLVGCVCVCVDWLC